MTEPVPDTRLELCACPAQALLARLLTAATRCETAGPAGRIFSIEAHYVDITEAEARLVAALITREGER